MTEMTTTEGIKKSARSLTTKKLFIRLVLTPQHKIFLIIQAFCFLLHIITVSISGASLSIVRNDAIIKVFSVFYKEESIENMSSLAKALLLTLISSILTIILTIIGFVAAIRNVGFLVEAYIVFINMVFLMQSSAIVLSSNFHIQINKDLGESMKIHVEHYYRNETHLINGKLNFAMDYKSLAWDTAQFHVCFFSTLQFLLACSRLM